MGAAQTGKAKTMAIVIKTTVKENRSETAPREVFELDAATLAAKLKGDVLIEYVRHTFPALLRAGIGRTPDGERRKAARDFLAEFGKNPAAAMDALSRQTGSTLAITLTPAEQLVVDNLVHKLTTQARVQMEAAKVKGSGKDGKIVLPDIMAVLAKHDAVKDAVHQTAKTFAWRPDVLLQMALKANPKAVEEAQKTLAAAKGDGFTFSI